MKKYLLVIVALISITAPAMAQDVDIDKKTGLVTVDNKEAFYLTPKNKSMMRSDFALENLQHEELAYLKYNEVGSGSNSVITYHMVFTQTGNQCTLTGFSMLSGFIKPLAKKIAGANLVKDGAVSVAEERKFIVLHNGNFLQDPNPVKETARAVSNEPQKSVGPADISLKENNIYNNSELVGMFKRTVENDVTLITVYNTSDALVCKATHPNTGDADWAINADGKTASILYNPATPLEKLFKYLVEKGYL